MKFPQHAVVETVVAAARYCVFNTFAMALVHCQLSYSYNLQQTQLARRRPVAPSPRAALRSKRRPRCLVPPRAAFGAFDCGCVTPLRGSCIVNVLTCELAGAAAANGDCGCCCGSGSGSCWAAAS